MSRRFITGVIAVAATIAMIGAIPARADNDDLKRFVGAAVSLYVLSQIVENARDGKPGKVHFQDRGRNRDGYGHPGYGHRAQRPDWGRQYAPAPRRHVKAPLPQHCLIRVDSRHTRYALGGRCVQRSYRAAHDLPRSCTMQLGRHGGWGYSLRCLRQRGYSL